MEQKIIATVGPTASGKTGLAIELAKEFDGEIVSADSMQIYTGLEISTAKPTAAERAEAVHHMIDFVDVTEKFDVTRYVELAKKNIDDILERGKLPIICGGTGLYVDSLVDGIEFSYCPDDTEIRRSLNGQFDEVGGEKMLEKLREIDPVTAKRLHANDRTRIVRAMSVYYLTGETISSQKEKSRARGSSYDCLFIGIDYRDRKKLYDRIDTRVDKMLEDGLLDEAKKYYLVHGGATSAQAIGIKELKPYLDGEKSLEECVTHLKFATHHYAKRQLTWFRKNLRINWLYPDENDNFYSDAKQLCRDFLEK